MHHPTENHSIWTHDWRVMVLAKARVEERQDENALTRDVISIGLATLGALVLVSLLYKGDAIGVIPASIAAALRTTVGIGAYAVPVWMFVIAAWYGIESRPVPGRRVVVGTGVLVLALLVLLQLRLDSNWHTLFVDPQAIALGGGYLGAGMAYVLLRLLGVPGAYVFVAGMAFMGVVLLTQRTTREIFGSVGSTVARGAAAIRAKATERARRPRSPRHRPIRLRTHTPKPEPEPRVELGDEPSSGPPVLYPPPSSGDPAGASGEDGEAPAPASGKLAGAGSRKRSSGRRGRSAATEGQRALMRDADLFALPDISMLTQIPQELESAEMREEAAEQIIKLEDTLESFNISAKVVHYERGPVLTRYEVEPKRGIRVNQVVRLADDLAMALAAEDVRVEAPIPGKSAIGIEVPNPTRATVSLRGLLEEDAYQQAPSKLCFALGRDIAGKGIIVDLGAMPHLLVAGATGAGKSVCLHALIVSLLMRATPDEVRMIMVDPKRVELAVYDGIPHLMAPVVHSVKQAADVLRKAIREMEKRYDKFALKGVVNLTEYNDLAMMPKQHATDEFDPLPHVIIIIDELADLMMQARAEFEFSICRLAQLARATGIHLVIATQRPSVKVVTGNIKANIPSRVALAVPSQHDSRTILDSQGAERLIGRGDMLYAPIDASKPTRIQGAFVARKDIERIVNHLRDQGEPEFDIIPEVPEGEEDYSGEIEASDELFAAAAEYVMQEQEASVSMIQRRFKVGYARAGRLIDMMERRGIVGPHEGSKPRQVLVAPGAGGALLGGMPGDDPYCPVPPDPRGSRYQLDEFEDGEDSPLVAGLDDEDEEFDTDTDDD